MVVDKSKYLAEFGERVKKRRTELNMNQQDLAERIGYKNKQTISYIENGSRNCTQDQIIALSKALNCTIEYLMGWEKDDTIEGMIIELTEEASVMDEKQMLRLLKYARLINKGDL